MADRKDHKSARAEGERQAELCADKAEEVSNFDREGAARLMLKRLLLEGPLSGEDLVNSCVRLGMVPHDMRAFGSVISRLAKSGRIACVGYCSRKKGHGTAGGRLWRAVGMP